MTNNNSKLSSFNLDSKKELRELEAWADRNDKRYQKELRRHPRCDDPYHPGCSDCVETKI